MAFVYGDRVKETTTTTGTGTITCAGAVSTYQSFSAGIGTGNQTDYCILSGNGVDWETGLGTVTVSGGTTTLSRDLLYSSSTGSVLSLTGTSTVFGALTAARAMNAGLFGPSIQPKITSASTGLTTWVNQGSSTITDDTSGIMLSVPSSTSLRIMNAPASTPYSFKALIANNSPTTASTLVGLGWYDGSNKVEGIDLVFSTGWKVEASRQTSPGTFTTALKAAVATGQNPMWVRIRNDGTTAFYQISGSGDTDSFQTFASVTISGSFMGATGYSKIAYFSNTNGTLMALSQGT